MKRLNILELHRTINEKNMRKTETYEKVLEICHRKITLGSETKQLRCMFEVPEYIPGYPIFDLNSCIKYLLTTLKSNGFLVKYYFPKILYISWDFDEIREDSRPKTSEVPQQVQQNISLRKTGLESLMNPMQIKKDNDKVIENKNLLTSSLKLHKKKTGKLELNLY